MEDKVLELAQARHKVLEALETAKRIARGGPILTQLERSLAAADHALLKLLRAQTIPFMVAIETKLKGVTVPGVGVAVTTESMKYPKRIIFPIVVEPAETQARTTAGAGLTR